MDRQIRKNFEKRDNKSTITNRTELEPKYKKETTTALKTEQPANKTLRNTESRIPKSNEEKKIALRNDSPHGGGSNDGTVTPVNRKAVITRVELKMQAPFPNTREGARTDRQTQKHFKKGDRKIVALKNKREQIQNKTPAALKLPSDKTNHRENPKIKKQ